MPAQTVYRDLIGGSPILRAVALIQTLPVVWRLKDYQNLRRIRPA